MKARLALLLVLLVAGCPGPSAPTPPAPPGTSVATASSNVAATWAGQADLVASRLGELTAAVEKGDKIAALAAHESAYFERYENPGRNIEVASQRNLPEEELDGKPRNVAIVREDLFAQVKSAIKAGAPAATVRALTDELSRKIREDAKKLDDMKLAPP